MTFSWAKILLMLIVVGLCSIFLINSHVVVLSSAQLSSSVVLSCVTPQNDSNIIDNCELANQQSRPSETYNVAVNFADADSIEDGLSASTNQVINVEVPPFDAASTGSINTKLSQQPSPNDIHYIPTYSARYINLAQHQSDEIKPNYLLAYEFISPPVPSLTIGYQVNFSPQLDWVLSTASSPSRLSAWKESNLLFVHAHTC